MSSQLRHHMIRSVFMFLNKTLTAAERILKIKEKGRKECNKQQNGEKE